MNRKVYVNITTRIVMDIQEGIDPYDVINESDYDIISNTPGADILDTEITDYQLIDSK